MDALKDLFIQIRAVRDCESVRALLFDCWGVAQSNGEAAAVIHARMLLKAIVEHDRERLARSVFGRWPTEAELDQRARIQSRVAGTHTEAA
ncbi:hypothetical protein VT84_13895 [Gemmata sp. SH-PL17]|nr:hypothetical protein VT84_13895 [Gemmata sp. SH-PL17]